MRVGNHTDPFRHVVAGWRADNPWSRVSIVRPLHTRVKPQRNLREHWSAAPITKPVLSAKIVGFKAVQFLGKPALHPHERELCL